MVIRSVITYGFVVWWTRVRLGSAERELTKLQRMVCIVMTSCIRTMPIASLEFLLGLFPLSVCIEG